MKLRHAAALALTGFLVLMLSGCWASRRRDRLADAFDKDGSFKLCLLNQEIDPIQVSDCIRTNPDVHDATTTGLCVPAGEREAFQRCQYTAQSEAQAHRRARSWWFIF
jgi:hypothetical protein